MRSAATASICALIVTLCAIPFAQDWMVCLMQGDTATIDAAELQPGQQARFTVAKTTLRVGTSTAFPLDRPLAGLRWSIEPPGQGIAISPNGVVTAATDARAGTYRVVASAGGQSSQKELAVYRPSEQPLVGTWAETAQIACGSERETTPATPIRELIFGARGAFSVTWFPFETRKDYWGTYESKSPGQLALSVDKVVGYRPTDLQPTGSARVDSKGRLVLAGGMWLGASPRERPAAIPCTQIFRRIR